jgi:hypothetical protein
MKILLQGQFPQVVLINDRAVIGGGGLSTKMWYQKKVRVHVACKLQVRLHCVISEHAFIPESCI